MLRLYDPMTHLVNYLLLRLLQENYYSSIQHTLPRALIPIVAVLEIYAYVRKYILLCKSRIWILRLLLDIIILDFFRQNKEKNVERFL